MEPSSGAERRRIGDSVGGRDQNLRGGAVKGERRDFGNWLQMGKSLPDV